MPLDDAGWDAWVAIFDDPDDLAQEWRVRMRYGWQGFRHVEQAVIRRWGEEGLARVKARVL